jgi:hypothetical protein
LILAYKIFLRKKKIHKRVNNEKKNSKKVIACHVIAPVNLIFFSSFVNFLPPGQSRVLTFQFLFHKIGIVTNLVVGSSGGGSLFVVVVVAV